METTARKRKNEFEHVTVATANVQGLNREGAVKQLITVAKEYNLDFLAIQESNIKGRNVMLLDSYQEMEGGSKQIVTERIKGKYRKFSLLNVHAPTEVSEETKKLEFYEKVEEMYNAIPNFDVKIRLGDMNAKIRREEKNIPIAGKESLRKLTNDYGQKLIQFAANK
ncbi:hypothetical protein RN001_014904 [Aquatica leii]|uniref:Endonuclease/exonuclease/phosphatase domain-containing protein n=1 Tax=Aquatica leii TaxID=1421715 RepID=A0AAN7NV23_9COLE|nr:hypothetical protein RN001_014904 [Aquatica leii]